MNIHIASMYCVNVAKAEDPAGKNFMKNGKPAMKGKCPVYGTGMYKSAAKTVLFRTEKQ